MSGQRSLLGIGARRVALGLLAVSATLLLAPAAAATPETDADDAVTAAWESNGAATGPLGDRQGGVYPIGAGFGQDFAGGKAFFTPATGAHIMHGAILEKYEALGGPADSDLGFPTIDEGPGRIGPDSRNTTFSAPDNPVIFWTPATGAHVVRGAINAAWDRIGGSAGPLGVPSDDEVFSGDVVSQKFTGGELSWNMRDKTFTTVPPQFADQLAGLAVPDDPASAINAARRAAGGPSGPLGAADGEPYKIGADGVAQNFTGGKIFYSPETGANVLTGQVLEKYESVGGPEGDLGFPTSSEREGGLGPNSRVVSFSADDQPVIFWTPDTGPVVVRGAMNAAWAKLDGAEGKLGAPTSDQTEDGDVITQRFSGGAISWDKGTHQFTADPADLATTLSGLQVPGQDLPATPSAPQASDTDGDKVFRWHWNWWWLVALIPALLVAGLVAGGVLRNRRRGSGPDGPFAAEKAQFGAVAPWGPPSADPAVRDEADDDGAGEAGVDGTGGAADSDIELFGALTDPDSVDTEPNRIETFSADADATQVETEFDEAPTQTVPRVVESGEPSPIEAVPAEFDVEPEPVEADFDEAPTQIVHLVGESDSSPDVPDQSLSDKSDEHAAVAEPAEYEHDEDSTLVEKSEGDSTLVEIVEEPAAESTSVATVDDDSVDEQTLSVPPAPQSDTEPEFPTGRHAAIDVDEPTPGRTAIHLPLENPHEAPDGYPIKADTRSGLYWSPSSGRYEDAVPEIWFASEELARTNGFVSAD